MKTHDYNRIAAIVGEDKIDALRDAGVDIADKPTKPTADIFGRWAKHPDFGDVVIVDNVTIDSYVMVMCRDILKAAGTSRKHVKLSDLTFPEEATRPEDVPVGEAWLVTVDDGEETVEGITAFKMSDTVWVTGRHNWIIETEWENDEVILIAPLIPTRPQDSGRERAYWEQQSQIDSYERNAEPETVTTEEEYEALPAGSIVAGSRRSPFRKTTDGRWVHGDDLVNVAGSPRYVLRYGWGGEND